MLMIHLRRGIRPITSAPHICHACRWTEIGLRHASTTRMIDKNGTEKGGSENRRSEPPLRWSNRTLIMLSSAVGASVSMSRSLYRALRRADFFWCSLEFSLQMYMLGVNQGYNAGKVAGTAMPLTDMRSKPPIKEEIASKDAISAAATPAWGQRIRLDVKVALCRTIDTDPSKQRTRLANLYMQEAPTTSLRSNAVAPLISVMLYVASFVRPVLLKAGTSQLSNVAFRCWSLSKDYSDYS